MLSVGSKKIVDAYVGTKKVNKAYVGSGLVYVKGYVPGTDWWEIPGIPVRAAWSEIAYGDGVFIVSSDNNNIPTILRSQDGISWKEVTLPVSSFWAGVAYGNGKFVLVNRYTPNTSLYSTDGVAWETSTMPSQSAWRCLTYGDGKFVAIVGDTSGSNKGAYSIDGINWTSITLPASAYWTDICYANGKFVVVGGNETNKILYSTNGTTWSSSTLSTTNSMYRVRYGAGKFVAVGYEGMVAYSTNGINWTVTQMEEHSYYPNGLAYDGEKFIAMFSNKLVCSSVDGISWKKTTEIPYPDVSSINGLIYEEDKFIAIGGGTSFCYSDSQGIKDIVYNKYTISLHIQNGQDSYGSIEGGGVYEEGSIVTVKAIANNNYRFVEWLENGVSVSTNETYAFAANSNRNLVAVFKVRKQIVYYGTAAALPAKRYGLMGASTGSMAIYAGGSSGSSYYSTVYGYSKSLTVSASPNNLPQGRSYGSSASLPELAVFVGGYNQSTQLTSVVGFNNSFTLSTSTQGISGGIGAGCTELNDCAIVAGGSNNFGTASSYSWFKSIWSYNKSLTRTLSSANIGTARDGLNGVTVGNHAIFGGGKTSKTYGYSGVVNSVSESLTVESATTKMGAYQNYGAATSGKYAIFAGGIRYASSTTNYVYYNNVYAYDENLTQTIPTVALSVKRGNINGATLGEYAVFFGGYTGAASKVVDAYDDTLTHTVPTELSIARNNGRNNLAVTIDDKTIIAGGNSASTVVDVYTLK